MKFISKQSSNLYHSSRTKVRSGLEDWNEDRDDDVQERRKLFEKTSQECVEIFQAFLVTFYRTKIFAETVSAEAVVGRMGHRQTDPKHDRTTALETLLKADDVEATSFASAATDDELLVDDLSRTIVEVRNGVHRLSKTFSTACQIIVDLFSVKFFDDEDDANFAAKFNHQDDHVIGELKEGF